MSWSIRPATVDDLDRVLKLEQTVYAGKSPWTLSQFQAEVDVLDRHFWLMTDDETDEQVFGYLIVRVGAGYGDFLNLAVHPDWRGRGIGGRLCLKMLDFLRRHGIREFRLDVRKSNEGAIQFYQKLDWEIQGLRKKMYSDGEDAYQMTLKVASGGKKGVRS